MKLQKQTGVAAVEFALLLPILLLLALGVVEFGRLIYQYNNLTKTVRNSARFLAAKSPAIVGYANFEEQALCLAVYANTTCMGKPVADDLSKNHVIIAYSTINSMSVITVSIKNYKAMFIESYIPTILGLGKDIGFDSISVSMRQVS